MIFVNNELTMVEGKKVLIMAEFTQLVNTFLKKNHFTSEDVDLCIKTAMKSEEEIKSDIDKHLDNLTSGDSDLSSDLVKSLIDLLL